MSEAFLVSLSGRPGVGKSTIACALARELKAVWLRIDSIEQAITDAGVLKADVDEAGYLAAQAVASDNLKLGRVVIADCVNDWTMARDGWRDVGLRADAEVIEVEIICSNEDVHRGRVETRRSEIAGLRLPDWRQTMSRDYHDWDREHLIIDTASEPVEACVRLITALVRSRRGDLLPFA